MKKLTTFGKGINKKELKTIKGGGSNNNALVCKSFLCIQTCNELGFDYGHCLGNNCACTNG
ncbi:hypothetical protein KTO58_10065 [Chitinophaga pendula]|uniref:hypothetical protein n=1 Tax=Chitinophaga TaxID=79328 RepID=UPI000BAF0306|nr:MULTISPECIES: hypothetical protein [Chitinophaga]ASZ12861.1 hypothetical protein CK934_18815 [Chitinophaga sp. MD30]UCJ09508.1 hypothetical protein KTO58_10065 [Chitinophaga pendula]